MIGSPSVISGNDFCTVNSSPLTFALKIPSKCSSVISPRGANPPPAFANNMSMLPFFAFTSAYKRSRSPGVRDLALDPGHAGADLVDRRIKFRLTEPGNEDICAFRDEPLGGGKPDTAAASGDNRHLAFEFSAHRSLGMDVSCKHFVRAQRQYTRATLMQRGLHPHPARDLLAQGARRPLPACACGPGPQARARSSQ